MSELFSGARVPAELIGRTSELNTIHRALYGPGQELRIVRLRGPGGYGKTRLLREVQRRAGHGGERELQGKPRPEDDWSAGATQLLHVGDLIDLTSVRLATAVHFQHQLQLALDTSGNDFLEFKRLFLRYRDRLVYQTSYLQMEQALKDAQEAFRSDYELLAERRRVVWVLDTAEKFPIPVTEWVEGILPEAVATNQQLTRTQDWLQTIIAADWLRNTTILVAGRNEFDWDAIFRHPTREPIDIALNPFDVQSTQHYFATLREDWSQRAPESPLVDYFTDLAQPERAKVFHLYTGGQPVRLALFTDVLVEGESEPEELNDTLEAARVRLAWREGAADPEILKTEQQKLEGQFLDVLFLQTADLRSQILMTLVRTQRPMSARSLAAILFSKPGAELDLHPSTSEHVREIEQTLSGMRDLSFMKHSPDGEYWLQDEIYTLFDSRQRSPAERMNEVNERKRIYEKMTLFLEKEIQAYERRLQGYWRLDRRKLLMEAGYESARQGDLSPLQVDMISFRRVDEIDPEDSEDRADARDRLESLILDHFYYRLRLDPTSTFNNDYFERADNAWWEYDEDFMTQIQVQLWRFLRSDLAWQFAVTDDVYAASGRHEPLRAFMLRMAEQDGAIRWLKRLHMRGRYADVQKLAKRIKKRAAALDPTTHAFHSWNHTITRNEIDSYVAYAQVFLDMAQTAAAAERLEAIATRFERALQTGDRKRAEDPFSEAHPAFVRIERLAGSANFFLGYARASLGRFAGALESYQRALPYLREARFEPMQVICMFNMARVLAERGHTKRAARICNDALEILDEHGRGGTRPYALAENTLALVYNRGHQPEDAWLQSAIAHACFERVEDRRGVGLAKLQIGEALRRLGDAYEDAPHSRPHESITALFALSERYLRDALRLFTSDPAVSQEVLRQIEAYNELGSSLREQAQYLTKWLRLQPAGSNDKERRKADRLLKEASEHFQTAEKLSLIKGKEHWILMLDALWGSAKVAYSQADLSQEPQAFAVAEAACETVVTMARQHKLLEPRCFLAPTNLHPAAEATEPTVLRLLSHAYLLMARIAFWEYSQREKLVSERQNLSVTLAERTAERFRRSQQETIRDDQAARECLHRAMRRYVISLGYGYLYSAKSTIIADVFDDLYAHVKRLSDILMREVAKELHDSWEANHLDQVKVGGGATPASWLEQSFGYRYVPGTKGA